MARPGYSRSRSGRRPQYSRLSSLEDVQEVTSDETGNGNDSLSMDLLNPVGDTERLAQSKPILVVNPAIGPPPGRESSSSDDDDVRRANRPVSCETCGSAKSLSPHLHTQADRGRPRRLDRRHNQASSRGYTAEASPITTLSASTALAMLSRIPRNTRHWLRTQRAGVRWLLGAVVVLSLSILVARVHIKLSKSSARRALQQKAASSDFLSFESAIQVPYNVVPRRLHSHNDYKQQRPLFTALSYGAASIEADVWLVRGRVHVGHSFEEAISGKTFRELYVEPLVKILERTNRDSRAGQFRGVYSMASDVPVQLVIDYKEDWKELWSAVYEDLQSLRQRGWLTTYHNATGQLEQSAITVIGTGEARLDYILAATERDIFYDAPMDRLGSPDSGVEWSPSVSPMASVSLKKLGYWPLLPWPFQNAAKRRMQECVEQAHRRNITARFWGHSSDPSSRLGGLWREAIWKATLDAGADWLNVDNFKRAAKY